jgi:hypothetical protein
MKKQDPIMIGYFPKITVDRPEWLKNDTVEKICSVSDCFSSGPDDWINQWKHNDLGLFDSEEIALSVVGANSNKFDMYAYKIYPFEFDTGKTYDFDVPLTVDCDLKFFRFLGYDAVNRSTGSNFECSALSCNHGAQDFVVNKYCLFNDFEKAYESTVEISKGGYEPGPWYLVEVYIKKPPTNSST